MEILRYFGKAVGIGAILIVTCFVSANVHAAAPSFRWVQQAGGNNREYGTGIAVDSMGNSHVVGVFTSTNVTFGSSTLTNGGLFVAMYNADGDVVWARQINTSIAFYDPTNITVPYFEYSIAADALGNTYFGGCFFGGNWISFEGVAFTNNSTSDGPGYPDLFLAKYDASGNLAWARNAGPADGTTNSIRARALVADAAGNCYLAGDYVNAPGMGLTNQLSPLGYYVAKLDTDGNLVWSRTMASLAQGPPGAWAVALDNSGGYFVSGPFTVQTITFGSVTLTNIISSLGGWWSQDIFTVRYDSAGNLLWAKSSGISDVDYFYSQGVDLIGMGVDATGDCYVCVFGDSSPVSFGGCVVTNGGCCLAKYDPEGNVLWCRNISTNTTVLHYAADAVGNSYIFGDFTNVANFDGLTLTNPGSAQYPSTWYPLNFLTKLGSDGHVLWAKQFGGGDFENSSSGTSDWRKKGGISVDAAGNSRVTGFIRTTNAIFDDFILSPISDDEDVFVARLDADPPHLDFSRDGNSLVFSWFTNQPGFVLECANELPTTNGWLQVTNPVAVVGIRNFVTNPITSGSQFYRLRKP